MEYVEENRIENVISWVLKGRGFVVHDPDRLVELLPLFFSQTKYRSFRRQLNMWHFERIEKGPSKGAFIHPYFVQGNRELCHSMSRHVSLKPTRGNSIGSNGSSSSSTQSDIGIEQERSLKIGGNNSETIRRGNSCSSSSYTVAALCPQHSPLVEAVPSMNVPLCLVASSDVTFTSTERGATFDTPDPVSFVNSDIDLPFIEPDPIRAVVVDSSVQKNSTKSLSRFSEVPSYHQLEPSMTVANFLKDALFSEPITTAIWWDDDLDFLSCSEDDDRSVMINNFYGHHDDRVVPSFIMPRSQNHLGGTKTALAAVATVPPAQRISSLFHRQVTKTFKNQHENYPAGVVAPQFVGDGSFGEDAQFMDFDYERR